MCKKKYITAESVALRKVNISIVVSRCGSRTHVRVRMCSRGRVCDRVHNRAHVRVPMEVTSLYQSTMAKCVGQFICWRLKNSVDLLVVWDAM